MPDPALPLQLDKRLERFGNRAGLGSLCVTEPEVDQIEPLEAEGFQVLVDSAAQIRGPPGMCDQDGMLRDGRADVALMHTPFNSLAGFDSVEMMTEGQVAILPARHPLAARKTLSLAEIADVPGLPLARWPSHDTYPPGPGPEIHDQTQLAQLIALGRTMAVFPESARTWLWDEHAAVPLSDASPVTTHIVWPAHSRSRALAGLIRTASRL